MSLDVEVGGEYQMQFEDTLEVIHPMDVDVVHQIPFDFEKFKLEVEALDREINNNNTSFAAAQYQVPFDVAPQQVPQEGVQQIPFDFEQFKLEVEALDRELTTPFAAAQYQVPFDVAPEEVQQIQLEVGALDRSKLNENITQIDGAHYQVPFDSEQQVQGVQQIPFDFEQFQLEVEALDRELNNNGGAKSGEMDLYQVPSVQVMTTFKGEDDIIKVPSEGNPSNLPPIKIESSFKPMNPCMLQYVMQHIEEFSEYDMYNINSIIYNIKSKNVATLYQAATVQKVLKIIAFKYGLPMKELFPLCGSEYLNKCCCQTSKGYCKKPVVYGHFFCERHLPGTDLVNGLKAYEKRLQNGNII